MKKLIFGLACVMALVVGCDSPTEIKKDTVIIGNDLYHFRGNVDEVVFYVQFRDSSKFTDTLFTVSSHNVPNYATKYDSINVIAKYPEIRAYKKGDNRFFDFQSLYQYGVINFKVTQITIYAE